jgi:hypothetical protein
MKYAYLWPAPTDAGSIARFGRPPHSSACRSVREPEHGIAEGTKHRLGKLGVSHCQDSRGLEAEASEHCERRIPRGLFVVGWLAETETQLLTAAIFHDQPGERAR